MTDHEVWGEKELPDMDDFNNQTAYYNVFANEKRYGGLEEFWKQVTAISDPFEYGMIGRSVEDDQDHASTVAVYFDVGRQEIYEPSDDLSSVDISFIDEEGTQHGFQTITEDYEDVASWMQEIIELEDDLSWSEWSERQ